MHLPRVDLSEGDPLPRTCKHLKQLRGEDKEKERMEAKPEAGVSPS